MSTIIRFENNETVVVAEEYDTVMRVLQVGLPKVVNLTSKGEKIGVVLNKILHIRPGT